MPRRANRQRRRGRRGGGVVSNWHEWQTGHLLPGSSVAFNRNNFEFPKDRSYRVLSVEWQFASEGPAIVQIRGYGPNDVNSSICNSGPLAVSLGQVLRGRLRYPSMAVFSRDPFPNTQVSPVFLALDCLCPYKGDIVKVIYSVKVDVLVSPEEVPEVCPKNGAQLIPLYSYMEDFVVPSEADVLKSPF